MKSLARIEQIDVTFNVSRGGRREFKRGRSPLFFYKFPLSLIRRGGQGVRLPIINYTPKIGGVNGYKT